MVRVRASEGDTVTYFGEYDLTIEDATKIAVRVVERRRGEKPNVDLDPWYNEYLTTVELGRLCIETIIPGQFDPGMTGQSGDEYGFDKYHNSFTDDMGTGHGEEVCYPVAYSDYHIDLKKLFDRYAKEYENQRGGLLDI
jgi:hypothetical protein